MKINKILIANRGEIALRIIRACKALGIKSVAVYSTADKDSLHVKFADEKICIGSAQPAKSYRNPSAIIAAAELTKSDAIHPGYGFLSEDPKFAHIVEQHNIKFIGPSSKHIQDLGDKINSKNIMDQYGIKTIPGSTKLNNADEGFDFSKKIGFPVIIKASNGGGGKGIRIVHNPDDFHKLFQEVEREAAAVLGKGDIYVEKYIINPRHVEFQILSDGKKAVHLFERDCSLQRRRQKVWEEAPSTVLTKTIRDEYTAKLVRMIEGVGYEGVGTIECLFSDGELYFMEMNTRLQVEHTVTEEITGLDLVQEQIKVASGIPLTLEQKDIQLKGHAIQCRITSEDPDTFMPSPGLVTEHTPALGPYARIDTLLYTNYQIQPYYDSLISKLIAKGKTRQECLNNLEQALKEYIIKGPKHTIPLFQKLLSTKDVQDCNFHINWLEQWLELQTKL
ncbi:MAG: acetyl-CoA carboxylase biotin carboxylase subunit [Alphaproteobacteria bacterium]|nr:MAG: acetyl-CoA carboxylase biotin carboxylase subunit [Alphaproteobacteria bacterium]